MASALKTSLQTPGLLGRVSETTKPGVSETLFRRCSETTKLLGKRLHLGRMQLSPYLQKGATKTSGMGLPTATRIM